MDVRLAADGRRIAEPRGYACQGLRDLCLRLTHVAGRCGECRDALDRADPRAEVLGGKIVFGDLTDIGVDVVGGDGVSRAIIVEIREKLFAREVSATFCEPLSCTWRERSVVSPNEPLACAYSSFPTRT